MDNANGVYKQDAYKVGSVVAESGCYVCVPCGFRKFFRKGSKFPQCMGCMKRREFTRGYELWEKINES